MDSLLTYLKRGLSRKLPKDRMGSHDGYSSLRVSLKNLWPFLARHWRKGVLAALLIISTALLSFPQPLIMRYLVDNVILNRQLQFLVWVILLLVAILAVERLAGLLRQFYCSRFEQEVIVDIQQGLFDRVLHFPKSFFDKNETGYLMSRLSSDVQGLRWFFSGTIVYIITNLVRFVGGAGLLLYLEWRLAIGVLLLLPGIALGVRYFSRKARVLSHHSMEQEAKVSTRLQESLSSASLIKAFSSEDSTVKRLTSQLKAAFHISLEQSTVSSVANVVVSSMPGIALG